MIRKCMAVFFIVSTAFFLDAKDVFASEPSQMAILISGIGGSHPFDESFHSLQHEVAKLLIKNDYKKQNLFLFSEKTSTDDFEWGTREDSSLANLRSFFNKMGKRTLEKELDRAFVLVIGHANGRDDEAMIHLPGKDISLKTIQQWIREIPAKEKVVIVLTPQGESWLKAMAEDGVITLVGNHSREFDVLPVVFTQFLTEGLAVDFNVNQDAEENDQTVKKKSLSDLFIETQIKTQQWYQLNHLQPTEIGAIDADGDGHGSQMIEEIVSDNEEMPIFVAEREPTSDFFAAEKIYFKFSGGRAQ